VKRAALGLAALAIALACLSCSLKLPQSRSKKVYIINIDTELEGVPEEYQTSSPFLVMALLEGEYISELFDSGNLNSLGNYQTLVGSHPFCTTRLTGGSQSYAASVPQTDPPTSTITISGGRIEEKLYNTDLTYWVEGGNFYVAFGVFIPSLKDFASGDPKIFSLSLSREPHNFDSDLTTLNYALDFFSGDLDGMSFN